MKNHPRRFGFKKQRGQGMTEYIIITALIAVAAIGVVTFFGGTIRAQFAGMAKEVAGQDGGDMVRRAGNSAGDAQAEGQKNKKGLNDYHDGNPH